MVRQQLEEPVRKIATRNMYFDPAGKHVRTKKEATNENGLLPGYTILSEEKMKKDVLCLLQKIIRKITDYDHIFFTKTTLADTVKRIEGETIVM